MCDPSAMRRRLLVALGVLAVATALAIGLAESDSGPTPGRYRADPAADRRALAGAPAPLARLHRQANRLLPGEGGAFRRRLRELRGYPVVINKWGSFCGPCRAEFQLFHDEGVRLGKRVAFLGLDSADNREAALRFLREHPVPYPSYEDPRETLAQALDAGRYWPVTIFVDRRGKSQYVHYGEYKSRADLTADIERYALAG